MYFVRPPPKLILEEIESNEQTTSVNIQMIQNFLDKRGQPRKPKGYLSVFKEINSSGMPWDRKSSSEEEESPIEEKKEENLSEIDQLQLAHEILQTLEWRGSLIISIPMFGIERKVGGAYALQILEKQGDLFIGKDHYDNESTNVEMYVKFEKNEVNIRYKNSDDIYFEGILNMSTFIIHGKLENSDTPQGKGTFELKGFKKKSM